MNIELSEFMDIVFPQHKNIVYIIYFIDKDSNEEILFYVGESSRGIGRFGDYLTAQFTASTDFKVGEAIRYIKEQGFEVGIKYKESSNRKKEEQIYLKRFRRKYRLLNDLEGYNYKKANKQDERKKVHEYVNIMIQEKGQSIQEKMQKAEHQQKYVSQKRILYQLPLRKFVNSLGRTVR